MPIDYKKYPANWKTEIRPTILHRADNKCEFCKVPNYAVIFRGFLNNKEVYQNDNGDIFNAFDSVLVSNGDYEFILPLSGNPNQKAIKVVLTIAHLNNDVNDNNFTNLRALCQRCHNRLDAKYRAANRKKNANQLNLM